MHSHVRRVLSVIAAFAGAALAGSDYVPVTATPTDAAVDIVDDDYSPGTVTIPAGSIVIWTNTGHKRHDVVGLRGEFRSNRLTTGEQYQVTFEQPGTYYYQCTVHWSMAGTVLVTTSDDPAP